MLFNRRYKITHELSHNSFENVYVFKNLNCSILMLEIKRGDWRRWASNGRPASRMLHRRRPREATRRVRRGPLRRPQRRGGTRGGTEDGMAGTTAPCWPAAQGAPCYTTADSSTTICCCSKSGRRPTIYLQSTTSAN